MSPFIVLGGEGMGLCVRALCIMHGRARGQLSRHSQSLLASTTVLSLEERQVELGEAIYLLVSILQHRSTMTDAHRIGYEEEKA
mmetsp:Transcript_35320/g.71555  ORF Transcript_35320/g.71555 Transcript_35320/m.71555 type:complete len:84 (-) Transcript_35320:3133-3384(-)